MDTGRAGCFWIAGHSHRIQHFFCCLRYLDHHIKVLLIGRIKIDQTPIKEWLQKTSARLQDERGYSTDHNALYYACHTGLADWEGQGDWARSWAR